MTTISRWMIQATTADAEMPMVAFVFLSKYKDDCKRMLDGCLISLGLEPEECKCVWKGPFDVTLPSNDDGTQ